IAGGSPRQETGGAANRVCLTAEPVFDNMTVIPVQGRVAGVQYYLPDRRHTDVPCAVCHTARSASFMVPGTNSYLVNVHLLAAISVAGMEFISYYDHLMEILTGIPELQRTGTGMLTQASSFFGGALLGETFGGPGGAAIGGFIGGVVGYMFTDFYDPLIKGLRQLTSDEKREVVNRVQEHVGSEAEESLSTYVATETGRVDLIKLLRKFKRDKKDQ
ncbi:hypothetical protein BaRGS_00015250, partial [Batillaria attramentaria]